MTLLAQQSRFLESWARGACLCFKCCERRDENQCLMVTCTECGNKRCPKATDHTLACTGSNAPGQEGSLYV